MKKMGVVVVAAGVHRIAKNQHMLGIVERMIPPPIPDSDGKPGPHMLTTGLFCELTSLPISKP